MNKHTLIPLALALAALLTACDTLAVKKADKNFERAWLAYTSLRTDKAAEYFSEAARYYEQALNQDPPSRVAKYPSSRIKAGMSNYFAGRYEQCIASMIAARRFGERLWEADLFTGLAHARLGNRDNAEGNFALFLEGRFMMPALNATVRARIAGLKNGEDTGRTAEAVEQAAQAQVVDIIRRTLSPSTVRPASERCDGAFWWRRSKQPCSASKDTAK